jgi:hypothetical protein
MMDATPPSLSAFMVLGLALIAAGCGGDPNPYRNECRSESCAVDIVVPPSPVLHASLRERALEEQPRPSTS